MPEVTLAGPEGRLEARYHHARIPDAPFVVVLHPHPSYGGTMNNRVVYGLYQGFARRGFSVLRFNFRGVGKSQGTFDRGEGELADAAAALDWAQAMNPQSSVVWVAGYSFGAWIGMQLLMRRPEINRFVSVAPPASQYDFTFLAPCPSSGLIVQGTADTVSDPGATRGLVDKLRAQRGLAIDHVEIDGADHFFHDHLPQLSQSLDSYLYAEMGGMYAAE